MDDIQLGRSVRALRHRHGWTQHELSAHAGVSSSSVSLVETGQCAELAVRTTRRIAAAAGARLSWRFDWRGGELDRLLDADHSALAEAVARLLEPDGWKSIAEASYNLFGERGRIDLLAFHPASGILLVVEVKTVIADLQELLGRLDAKVRLGPSIARKRGWMSRQVRPMLVVLEGATPRRRIRDHAALLAPLSLRGVDARRWLAHPHPGFETPPPGLLVIQSLPTTKLVGRRKAGRQRVRQSTLRAGR